MRGDDGKGTCKEQHLFMHCCREYIDIRSELSSKRFILVSDLVLCRLETRLILGLGLEQEEEERNVSWVLIGGNLLLSFFTL